LVLGIFETASHEVFADWLWTEILLISASWVARISSVNHLVSGHISTLMLLCSSQTGLLSSPGKCKIPFFSKSSSSSSGYDQVILQVSVWSHSISPAWPSSLTILILLFVSSQDLVQWCFFLY
jgi:hypothetical protein